MKPLMLHSGASACMRVGSIIIILMSSGTAFAGDVCSEGGEQVVLKRLMFNEGEAIFVERPSVAEGHSIELNYRTAGEPCLFSTIDLYDFEGGPPKLEASFVYSVEGNPNLFAIVSWPLEHSGLDMRGRFYAVHAYERENDTLIPNKLITSNVAISSGIVGFVAGENHQFKGATEAGVKSLLASQKKSSVQAACDPSVAQQKFYTCAFAEEAAARKQIVSVRRSVEGAYAHDLEQNNGIIARFDIAQSGWASQIELDLQAQFPFSQDEDIKGQFESSFLVKATQMRAF